MTVGEEWRELRRSHFLHVTWTPFTTGPITCTRIPRVGLYQKIREKPEQPACILEMFYYVMQSRTHPAILLKGQDSELQLTLFSGGKGAGSLAESPDAG